MEPPVAAGGVEVSEGFGNRISSRDAHSLAAPFYVVAARSFFQGIQAAKGE
ncbi:hypothetical protein BGLT_03899 [Caballeronia glathei]|jgi:hypothetical protein|uniref:hypothetical protein n=1 Tax=Caballeronia glathei TaxID=60547 RepID=UPI000503FBCB|nr:hypothetical protein [Caballeronia glathei]CDY74958.1 hypothetical protein BGLT_03899 [Caballeronia glathei]